MAMASTSRIQVSSWFLQLQQWPKMLKYQDLVGKLNKQSSGNQWVSNIAMKDGDIVKPCQFANNRLIFERNLQILRTKQLVLSTTCRRKVLGVSDDFLSPSLRLLSATAYLPSPKGCHLASWAFSLSCRIHNKITNQSCRFTHSCASSNGNHVTSNSLGGGGSGRPENQLAEVGLPALRLQNLAKILHCSTEEMRALAVKHPFFSHLSPQLIKEKLFIMLSFGLSHEFVREHARLLYQTSASELHRRLQLLQKHSFLSDISLLQPKFLPYYLECDIPYFDYALQNLIAQREALEGCSGQIAYLQFRLKCSEAMANNILHTFPLKRQVTNVRLKALLDFLLNEAKLPPEFVLRHKRLMAFSTRRLRSRLQTMQALGITSERSMVYIWQLPEKEFKNKYEFNLNPEE